MSRIEEKYGLKTGHAIALFVILVLNIIWVVSTIVVAIENGGTQLHVVIPILMFIIAAYYACYGYKKPHGNHMRYLLLCSAAFSAVQYVITGFEYPTYITITFFIIIILKTYMAGRLGHYKQNVVISIIVLICQCLILYNLVCVLNTFGDNISFVTYLGLIGPVTLWLAIAGAYITRFKLHKEAGLADAPKAE